MFLHSNRCSLSKSGLNRVLPFDNLPAEVCQKQTKIASHTKATNSEKWSQCRVPKPAVPLKTTGFKGKSIPSLQDLKNMFTAIYGGGFLNPPPPFYTLLASVLVWPVLSNSRKVNTTFIFMKFMLMLCVSGSQPRLACQQLPAKTNTSQISHNSLPPASSMHTISACPVYQPIKLQWSLNLALASNFFLQHFRPRSTPKFNNLK